MSHIFALAVAAIASQAAPPNNTVPVINLILMAVYVVLTLAIAIGTIWAVRITRASLDLARAQMQENKQQSLDAQKASEEQSKAAIKAIHEQIEAAAKQSQEAIQNQHKPVILPVLYAGETPGQSFVMKMENDGLGVAMNVWGTVSSKQTGHYYSSQKAFFLVPSTQVALVTFRKAGLQFTYNFFEGFTIFPLDDSGDDMRVMLTYSDVFGNKYLVVFDHNPELEWKQTAIKQIYKTMDEKAINMSIHRSIHDHVAEGIIQ